MLNKMKHTVMLVVAILLAMPFMALAQQASTTQQTAAMIGGMSKAEFDRINTEGAQKVAAIKATSTALSEADKELMLQVAMGGMQQLEVSRLAVSKASSEQVRQLAQSEVEEQTGLSAKLKEIAKAKGVELPGKPDAQTQAMLTKLSALSGSELDTYYVAESGVKGHEKLDKVMSSVKSKAKDANLKSLAAAAHPLVQTHLKVSRAALATMKGQGSQSKSTGK
jgi:putative membrane protein